MYAAIHLSIVQDARALGRGRVHEIESGRSGLTSIGAGSKPNIPPIPQSGCTLDMLASHYCPAQPSLESLSGRPDIDLSASGAHPLSSGKKEEETRSGPVVRPWTVPTPIGKTPRHAPRRGLTFAGWPPERSIQLFRQCFSVVRFHTPRRFRLLALWLSWSGGRLGQWAVASWHPVHGREQMDMNAEKV